MKVVYILWLRQIKRHLRSKARIIGSFGQPILYLLALGFGFGPIYARAGGGDYIQFIAPGIIAMSILFTSVFMGIEIIWDRQFGFLKETLVAPVSRFKIMLGRTIGGATLAVLQGIVVMLIAMAVGFRPQSGPMVLVGIFFMILISLLFTALGTAIACMMEDMHGFQIIMNFMIMPLFFLSGALFPFNGLPAAIHAVVTINPLTYGVDGLRQSLTGIAQNSMLLDAGILAGVTLLVLGIGSYLFSKIEA